MKLFSPLKSVVSLLFIVIPNMVSVLVCNFVGRDGLTCRHSLVLAAEPNSTNDAEYKEAAA